MARGLDDRGRHLVLCNLQEYHPLIYLRRVRVAESGEDSDKGGGLTKSIDQYEYVAIVIPGAMLLFGLLFAFPGRFPWTFDKNMSLGALGLFLIAGLIAGQLLHAIGDLVEILFWLLFRGWPTDWVTRENSNLLDSDQRRQLLTRVKALIGTTDPACGAPVTFRTYDPEAWRAIVRRIYAFNRTGGLMMGLMVALGILAALFLTRGLCAGTLWQADGALFAIALVLALLALSRFYQFSRHYGRELFVQFLALP
jgi:hypothetical protein